MNSGALVIGVLLLIGSADDAPEVGGSIVGDEVRADLTTNDEYQAAQVPASAASGETPTAPQPRYIRAAICP
ncbi:hypothetical protein, partial [Demequina sediminicola]|uniref:hypothetical protein n=1 Tax=Demequina sediminicola TaxID=1095026 RepID=UPI001F38D635